MTNKLTQAYLCSVAWHPVLRNREELHLFLSHEGDLANCRRWQDLLHCPSTDGLDSLLGGLTLRGRYFSSCSSSSSAGSSRASSSGGCCCGGSGGLASSSSCGSLSTYSSACSSTCCSTPPASPATAAVAVRSGGSGSSGGKLRAGAGVAAAAPEPPVSCGSGGGVAGMAFVSLRARQSGGSARAVLGVAKRPLTECEACLREAKELLRWGEGRELKVHAMCHVDMLCCVMLSRAASCRTYKLAYT